MTRQARNALVALLVTVLIAAAVAAAGSARAATPAPRTKAALEKKEREA